jgi:beta-glucosidase
MADALPRWKNPDLPLPERVDNLLSQLTLEEKIAQMLHESPAIERLGIPDYNWWNECLHGVARAGVATVFPQAIGLAAMWDAEMMHHVACAISDEARARHHAFARRGDRGIYKGLTFWTPNINIFRDPRWGRGHETYGECPHLTSRLAVEFIRGLQGDHPKYLKLVATPKHFAVHSGPEKDRHSFDARVSAKDLRETYLPHFRDAVIEAKAASVMSAYNRTNGEPCTASTTLLQDILRREWGFDGYVVSDCGAVLDIWENHKVVATKEEAAAMAVKNGCDLNCGCMYTNLGKAVVRGLITEAEIDIALRRLLEARFRLGMFDPEEHVPYARIPYAVNDNPVHSALALQTARKCMTLLKNDGLLPLRKDLDCIAVIGPNAADVGALLGNYAGTPSHPITPLEGIRSKVSPKTKVLYALGCEMIPTDMGHIGRKNRFFVEAELAAERADVVIMCLGLNSLIEGEQGDASNADAAGDRVHLNLHGIQQQLLEAVVAVGKPVVLVVMSGSGLALGWADGIVPAILQAWYPGQAGGAAIADVLFGDYNPSGRLPITWVRGLEQLPPMDDYSMEGRTYRFLKDQPLYPFGWGLSYTTFAYLNLRLSSSQVNVQHELLGSVEVMNTGDMEGEEVVQLYISHDGASTRTPLRDLRGFARVHLRPGETKSVEFRITPRDLSLIDDDGARYLEPHRVRIHVGGCQPDARSADLGGIWLEEEVELVGSRSFIPY